MFQPKNRLTLSFTLLLIVGCGSKEPAKLPEAKAEANTPAAVTEAAAPAPVAVRSEYNLDVSGRAMAGYDVVSYYDNQEPLLGLDENKTDWQGATWRFASPEHLAAFQADPEKYAPSNGGFCTFGIVIHKKLDGNPTVWHLKEGRLYLFLNAEVRDKFLLDENANLARVAENWPALKTADL